MKARRDGVGEKRAGAKVGISRNGKDPEGRQRCLRKRKNSESGLRTMVVSAENVFR